MFSLTPLGDLTRFRRSDIKSEVYLVTEDVCIKSHGILLAARSAKLEKMVEESENIPAVEFSDNIAGLEDCLDLVYGGSVDIRDDNCKSIYKSGKLFQIREMMDGALSWIAVYVTYDKFWKVYLELKNLHDDTSVFVDTLKGYFSADGDNFVEHTTELCSSEDNNATTAVVELLSRIDNIRVVSVMDNIVDTAIQNNETLSATLSSMNTNNYLQTVVSSTVTYIENFLKSGSCDESHKSRCKQTLQKASSVCANVEALRTINKILFDTSFQPSFSGNFAAQSIKNLNWERVKQLTSPTTPHDVIKSFTENAGAGIHPCVVVEIVLKWWRVRTDREHVDMSFITPLITTIQNVRSEWYVCRDDRYKGLMRTLDIPEPTAKRYMGYRARINNALKDIVDISNYRNLEDCISNHRNLEDCISKGDGTPVQLKDLYCSKNMKRYRQSVPAFRYNAAVFPPYGDTKHHWYISTDGPDKHVSLITDSKQEIFNYINNAWAFNLHFVPLPETL